MSGCCPTCGQPLAETDVKVDLTRNIVVYRKQSVQLWPMVAEILFVLARHYPEVARHEHLRYAIWGGAEGERNEPGVIVTLVSRLRRLIAPLGLAIGVSKNVGYYLIKHDEPVHVFPYSTYTRWTVSQVALFQKLCADGVPRDEIAKRLGWTVPQVKSLYKYLRRQNKNQRRLPYSSGIPKERVTA